MSSFIFLNPRLGAEVVKSGWALGETDKLAEEAVGIARSIAPVGNPAEGDEHAGQYRDSLHVETTDKGARVIADPLDSTGKSYAVYVEFGSIHNPAFHVLGETAAALGGMSAGVKLGVQGHRRSQRRGR